LDYLGLTSLGTKRAIQKNAIKIIPFKMMQVNTSKSAAHQIQGTKFRACSGGKVPLKNTGPAAVGRRFGE